MSFAGATEGHAEKHGGLPMRISRSYIERKRGELLLLASCLAGPPDAIDLDAPDVAVERKFRLASVLKAEQLLKSLSVTETARPPARWRRVGDYRFSFGYQRADLEIQGPPIYRAAPQAREQSIIYAASGMSAIAALLMASLQLRETIDVLAPSDCYSETRELMRSFGRRIRTVSSGQEQRAELEEAAVRFLWLDSSTHSSFQSCVAQIGPGVDFVAFDTTCFWRGSNKITHAIDRALQIGIPVVLVRSHAKLDNLGIEYGRLGSIVVLSPERSRRTRRSLSTLALVSKLRDAVRLMGAAPVLAHLPPFESHVDYRVYSAARTASIIRNTRRLVRTLKARLPSVQLSTFQHGLYFTIAACHGISVDEVRRAIGAMAQDLARRGLPFKHAGSFGFDFTAAEWCADAVCGDNLIRVCGGDLPLDVSDEIGQAVASWCLSHHLAARSRYNNNVSTNQRAAA